MFAAVAYPAGVPTCKIARVSQELFDEMKSYVGFDAQDAANLRTLVPIVVPHLPRVVDRFYAEIFRRPRARAVLHGKAQIERLKYSLTQWLESLFSGDYGDNYYLSRISIGRTHVRVGLPQHYMFVAMEVIAQELEHAIVASDIAEPLLHVRSLRKLLTLDTGLMLESYKETYAEETRRIERSVVQERLTRAEHLAEIGQLAASLAHEIKNPLAGISGAVQVIRDSLTTSDSHRPILDEILRQINRLDRTVKDLLVYARPQAPQLEPCDVRNVLLRVLTTLKRQPDLQSIRFDMSVPDSLGLIHADENQVEQVLLNLLLNAAHASKDDATVRVVVKLLAGGVRLGIIDEGHGMSPDVLAKAFEPFFTTKSKGTGLGLPICKRIVEMHGGVMRVDSRSGEGTTITIDLPRDPPVASAPKVPVP